MNFRIKILNSIFFVLITLEAPISWGQEEVMLTLTPVNPQVAINESEGIDVSVSLNDAPELRSLAFTIGFDPDIIDIPIEDEEINWNDSRVPQANNNRTVTKDNSQIRFSVSRSSGLVDEAVQGGDGVIVTFKVLPIGEGNSELSFSNISLVNFSGDSIDDIDFSSPAATITVVGQPVVAFQQGESSISEGSSNTVNVVVSGGTLSGDVTVDVVVEDIGTGSSDDFTIDEFMNNRRTLTFRNDGQSQAIQIDINDDMLVEGDETFSLRLENVSDGATRGSPATHTITIQDNDKAAVQFQEVSSEVNEGSEETHVVNVELKIDSDGGEISESVMVEVGNLGGTAQIGENEDYTIANLNSETSSVTLEFDEGAVNGDVKPINFSIKDDEISEGDLTVELNLENITGPAEIVEPSSHTITIIDNEPRVRSKVFNLNPGQTAVIFDLCATNTKEEVEYIILVSTESKAPEDYDETTDVIGDGVMNVEGGTLSLSTSPPPEEESCKTENNLLISTLQWMSPLDAEFRGIDRFFYIVKEKDQGELVGARSNEGRIVIVTNPIPWYPVFVWDKQKGFDWYNIKVFKREDVVTDEENPILPQFETTINGLEMTLEQYLLEGFEGFTPINMPNDDTDVDTESEEGEGDEDENEENDEGVKDDDEDNYRLEVRGWNSIMDTFGNSLDFNPELEGIQNFNFSVQYGPPLDPVPETMMIEEIENGVYELTFTVENASGYDIEIDASSNNNLDQIIRKTFSLDANNTVSFNQETSLEIHLSTPDSYRISVRGFNPCSDEVNECVDDSNANNDGFSEFVEFPGSPIIISEPVQAKTPGQPTGLFPKTGGIITVADESGEVATNLQWDPVAGATSYAIYLGAVGGTPILNFENVGNVTRQPVSLTPGSYSWMVIGLNESASVPFGQWSDSQRFEVVAKIDVPVITGVEKDDGEGNDVTSVQITWAPGTVPGNVDVWHYNSTFTSGRWNIKSDLIVTPDEKDPNTNGRFDFPDPFPDDGVDYLFIRGKTDEKEGKFKLFVIP